MINLPFVPSGKFIIIGIPKFRHIRVTIQLILSNEQCSERKKLLCMNMNRIKVNGLLLAYIEACVATPLKDHLIESIMSGYSIKITKMVAVQG